MKAAILQTGRAPEALLHHHDDYGVMCQNLVGADPVLTTIQPVLDGIFPADIHSADVWVVTGSRHGVHEDHDWIRPLEEFLRAAYAAHKKIIGICFGHQILAQALGRKVTKHTAGPAIGLNEYQLFGSDGEKTNIALHAWHHDQVQIPPAGAEVLMTSQFCQYAGFSCGERAISFQPHPEFSKSYMRDLIHHYEHKGLPHSLAGDALQSLKRNTSDDIIATKLRAFLEPLAA